MSRPQNEIRLGFDDIEQTAILPVTRLDTGEPLTRPAGTDLVVPDTGTPRADSADGEMPRGRTGRRNIRRLAIGGSAAVLVTAVAAGAALGLGGHSDAAVAPPAGSAAVTKVERRTLTQSITLDGVVDYGAATPMSLKATGTVTWAPARGAVITRGQTLMRVDDRPVVLLYGPLPQYRALAAPAVPKSAPEPVPAEATSETGKPGDAAEPAAPGKASESGKAPGTGGSKADEPVAAASVKPPPPFTGNDVEQFERNLRALGYHGFRVDHTFSADTATAVRKWQRDLGLPATGTVGVGDVVYAPGAVRVAQVKTRVGADMSADALSVTGMTRSVTVKAQADQANWAVKGAKVDVTLPTGKKVKGIVASLNDTTTAGQDAEAVAPGGDDAGGEGSTVPVTVTVADQKSLGQAGNGSVSVTYVAEQRKDVLCVPVTALVALVEGGYGLELAETSATPFVAVTPGMFADGMVEVTGPAVREGLSVRMPRQ